MHDHLEIVENLNTAVKERIAGLPGRDNPEGTYNVTMTFSKTMANVIREGLDGVIAEVKKAREGTNGIDDENSQAD